MKTEKPNWKKIARRAAQERDPDKLLAIIEELNAALEARANERRARLSAPPGHRIGKRLLFVDDEPNIRLTLPPVLEQHGFQVQVAANLSEALAAIRSHTFDVVLSDLNINTEGDGFTVIYTAHEANPACVTILLTGYMAAENAQIKPGNTIAVFGLGPVGQFCIACARLFDVGRIIAIDTIPSRLEMAKAQGAEVIDFNAEDPIKAIKELTSGIGVDRVIDAVGVDANRPHSGPAAKPAAKKHAKEKETVAPEANPQDGNWEPGDAPSIVLSWSVEAVAKAGTVSIIGVYGEVDSFPIGDAMEKNLTLTMGNCNHRRYIPHLIELVRSGSPAEILTQREPMTSVIEAYKSFDKRKPGWIKVKLEPATEASLAA